MGSPADLLTSIGTGVANLPPLDIKPPKPPPRQLKDPSELATLKPGEFFLDPTGAKSQKPFVVKTPEDWTKLPEGSLYVGPDNAVAKKPVTEPVSFGAQALYSMAGDKRRQQQVLASVYGPDAVKPAPDGSFLVKQGNKWLRPNSGLMHQVEGLVAGNALPTVGAMTGGAVGGGLGLESGPGAIATGLAGAGAGAAVGTAFNEMILGLMGFPASNKEAAANMSESALGGALGEGAGRLIGAAVPPIYAGVKSLLSGDVTSAAAAARKVLGTDPEALLKARELSRGTLTGGTPVLTAPSSIHKEAPYLKKVIEEFDPVFRESPILKGRDLYYEAAGSNLARALGIDRTEPLLSSTHSVDLGTAGQALQDRVSDALMSANAELDQAIAGRQAAATSLYQGQDTQLNSQISLLHAASDHLHDEAGRAVDAAFTDVRGTIDNAFKAANAGNHPADLWMRAGEQLNKVKLGIETVAGRGYNAGHVAAGNTPLATAPVISATRDLLDTLPEGFENQFPGVTRQLEAISKPRGTGILDDEGNEITRIPDVTLEQAHNLRTLLRSKVDWTKPNATVIDRQAKQLAGIVDSWMRAPSQPPQIKAGMAIIDQWDQYYSKNMGKFDQQAVQTIVQKMKEGFVDDAPALAKLVFDKDSTVNRENARKLLGPTLWKAVHAADAQAVLQGSIDQSGKIDAGRLSQLVTERLRSGLWTGSDVGEKTLALAQKVAAMKGKIPIDPVPGEGVLQTLQRANQFATEAKRLADIHPLELLKQETARLNAERAAAKKAISADATSGPLGFLAEGLPGEQTVGAIEAARRIMNNHDLMLAAATHFGADSPEFTLLRQTYAESILEKGGIKQVLEMPESVQNILFPGVTKDTAVTIAKNMDFLTGSGKTFGGGLAAAQRVLNPMPELAKLGGHPLASVLSKVPGGQLVGRLIIGKYYAAITWGVTHPSTIEFLARGLDGTPAEREAARSAFEAITSHGGDIGGAVGAALGTITANQQQQSVQRPPIHRRVPLPPPRPGDQLLQSLPR
jgi:hypothetical protein